MQEPPRAYSVNIGGYDSLSLANSNANIEDSDEEGDCKIYLLIKTIFVVIEYEIKPKYDEDGILTYQTILQIFDKRQAIKGIKKMKYDFKIKRRRLLRDGNLASYKKVVLLYKKAIESKLEDNLRLIANKVNSHSSSLINLLLVKNKIRNSRSSLGEAFL